MSNRFLSSSGNKESWRRQYAVIMISLLCLLCSGCIIVTSFQMPKVSLKSSINGFSLLASERNVIKQSRTFAIHRMVTTETERIDVASVENDDMLVEMKRITQPRSYPWFITEKIVELIEHEFNDISKAFRNAGEDVSSHVTMTTTTTLKDDDKQNTDHEIKKERVVILGSGWGGASFLKNIDTDLFDVTVISPRNHFIFTPMLSGAAVGTVEYRSICEPIREVNRHATYIEAKATNIKVAEQMISCESVACVGNTCETEQFDISYDRLIVTVGARVNTFGIKGVSEFCNYLRSVDDARRIRTALVNCFEGANVPTLTDEERIQALTFAVVGAGPAGVEFSAELRDFVEQDVPKYYPKLLPFVRIKVIEASPTILAPFEKSLQLEAINQMNRHIIIDGVSYQLIELMLGSSVKEVTSKEIFLNDGTVLPYGLCVWAGGNGPNPLTSQLIESLGNKQKEEQNVARGRLVIDPWMRVAGSGGTILSFGDCSCLTWGQLPPTAQVASQQGEYLAYLLNKNYNLSPILEHQNMILPPPKRERGQTEISFSDMIASMSMKNNIYAKPFQFLNLGILAYTGDGSALAQIPLSPNVATFKSWGRAGNAIWKSAYILKQFSMKNRISVLNDWMKRKIFGRDITMF